MDGSKRDALHADEEAEVHRVISGQLSVPEPQPAEDLEGSMRCLKGSMQGLSALDLGPQLYGHMAVIPEGGLPNFKKMWQSFW